MSENRIWKPHMGGAIPYADPYLYFRFSIFLS